MSVACEGGIGCCSERSGVLKVRIKGKLECSGETCEEEEGVAQGEVCGVEGQNEETGKNLSVVEI